MQSFQHCNSCNGSCALSDVKSDSLVLLYKCDSYIRMKQPFLVWFPGTANQSCTSSKESRTSCSFVPSVYLHPNCLSHRRSAGDLCAVNQHAAHQRTGNPNIHQPDLHLYQYVLFSECPTKVTSVYLCSGAELGSSWPAGGADFLPLSVSVTEPECETVPRGISAALCD